ncbi:MAG: hypothetical protein H6719_19855 [Sandaracinaceae bacterium]|nr:hypothetical protein [Sandaracinaceae bacterium]
MNARIAIALALTLSTGCSLIVEDEVRDLQPNLNGKRDVRVTLIDMNPHIGQYNDIQIIRPGDPDDPTSRSEVEARAIINPLPTGCFELFWPLGASFAANRVDFYADLNMDGMLSAPGEDHLWRRELVDSGDGEASLEFIHDVMFDDIGADPAAEPLSDLIVNVTGQEAHDGQLLVISVTRDFRESPGAPAQQTTPGIMVIGAVAGGTISETLPGVLDQGSEYTLDFDFGEGATICRGRITADAAGATVDSLDGWDCTVTDRRMVFRDVTSERRCAEP